MSLEPSLSEVIRDAIEARLLDVHTSIPGRVVKYDAAKQVADVLPVVKRPLTLADGTTIHEDLPVIPNVPVVWLGGGAYALHFPLAKDDCVQLVFSESAIANWRETGEVTEPGDLTLHDLSYPVAIPRIAPAANPIADAPASGEGVIIVGAGGVMRISTAHGVADFVAHAKDTVDALKGIQSQIEAIQTALEGAVAVAPLTPAAHGVFAVASRAVIAAQSAIATAALEKIPTTTLKAE